MIFDETTPRELIAALLPDVLVKGADWGADEIVGREEVEAAGGRVVSIPLEPGYSTTQFLKKFARRGRSCRPTPAAGLRAAPLTLRAPPPVKPEPASH